MAAHSSPRGSAPAATNDSAATRCSTLPSASRPIAVARRRAGSTVSTSTLASSSTAAVAAIAAASEVLPTPPAPQVTTTSLAAMS